MSLGMSEILMILVVVMILFGAKKIPELARSLGRAGYEFKKAKEELKKEAREFEEAIAENVEVTGWDRKCMCSVSRALHWRQ